MPHQRLPVTRAESSTGRSERADALASELLRKPVNTLAIVPKSQRITSLGRKSYNVLLYEAQEQGLDKDLFRTPLERVIRGVDFESNDHALIKKHLRAMVSTTVEWQSPTTGEGTSWNVSGLLAHARLFTERGQSWVEWSYAVNLKQELLEPTVFARLKLEVLSQLRTHAGIALYEICTRYKDVGRTSRQHWRWWRPVLSGQPDSERTEKLEYRIFKRDTIKPAVAEVCAITDLDIEMLEHKEGRFISEIQFLVRPKRQASLALKVPPAPVDHSLIRRAEELGVGTDKAEELLMAHGEEALRTGLDALAQRIQSAFPGPLRDHYRYLRTIIPGHVNAIAEATPQRSTASADRPGQGNTKEDPARRQAKWKEEWFRRRRESVIDAIKAMSPHEQHELTRALAEDLERRSVHPSIRKRLDASGWEHALVISEMVRFYAVGAMGDHWDQPTPEELLQIAAEVGSVPG